MKIEKKIYIGDIYNAILSILNEKYNDIVKEELNTYSFKTNYNKNISLFKNSFYIENLYEKIKELRNYICNLKTKKGYIYSMLDKEYLYSLISNTNLTIEDITEQNIEIIEQDIMETKKLICENITLIKHIGEYIGLFEEGSKFVFKHYKYNLFLIIIIKTDYLLINIEEEGEDMENIYIIDNK